MNQHDPMESTGSIDEPREAPAFDRLSAAMMQLRVIGASRPLRILRGMRAVNHVLAVWDDFMAARGSEPARRPLSHDAAESWAQSVAHGPPAGLVSRIKAALRQAWAGGEP